MERRLPRQAANMMIGFALLFIGLNLLKGQMESVGARELFTSIFPEGWGLGSNVLFMLIGATLTALIQSSSAATALTLAAMVSGLIGLESALAMVLGENIGTTLTANLAAVVGNRTAKRVARIHFLDQPVWGDVDDLAHPGDGRSVDERVRLSRVGGRSKRVCAGHVPHDIQCAQWPSDGLVH